MKRMNRPERKERRREEADARRAVCDALPLFDRLRTQESINFDGCEAKRLRSMLKDVA